MKPYYDDGSIQIYYGNATKDGILQFLIDSGVKVDLLLTDPPYGKKYVTNMGAKGRRANALSRTRVMLEAIANDESLDELERALPFVDELLLPDRHAYVFAAPESDHLTKQMLENVGFNFKNKICWDKGDCGTPGDIQAGCAQNWESILYFNKGRRPFPSGKRPRALIRHDWSSSWDPVHPNCKPVPLLEELILRSTLPGELILDPFMGSGTTLKAAKNLGRRCIGIELLEHHCRTAVHHRLQQSVLPMFAEV